MKRADHIRVTVTYVAIVHSFTNPQANRQLYKWLMRQPLDFKQAVESIAALGGTAAARHALRDRIDNCYGPHLKAEWKAAVKNAQKAAAR